MRRGESKKWRGEERKRGGKETGRGIKKREGKGKGREETVGDGGNGDGWEGREVNGGFILWGEKPWSI